MRSVLTTALAVLISLPAVADEYRSATPPDVERPWIGPEFHANRLQDWRLRVGRIECRIADEKKPIRTLHLLTHSVASSGSVTMSARVGWIDPSMREDATETQWAGFLLGAGGDHVDHRLTALTHHRPADDGGLLALVNGKGEVMLRRFDSGTSEGGWAIGGPILNADVPLLEPTTTRGFGFRYGTEGECELTVSATEQDDGSYTVSLRSRRIQTLEILQEIVVEDVDATLIDGGVALVSHRGPRKSRIGAWFRDWRVRGSAVRAHDDRNFGPILSAMHTVSDGTLNMTVQMPPIGVADTQTVDLHVQDADGSWRAVASANILRDCYTAPIRVEGWETDRDVPYRVLYDLAIGGGRTTRHVWEGTVRAEPDRDDIVIGALTCNKIFTGGLKWNHDGIWFPHNDLVAAVNAHRPDLVYFSGDQIYEGDLTGVQRSPARDAILDYHSKWHRWIWAFRDVLRDTPCIVIPDDHDVYHGNIWGAGGKAARASEGIRAQDSGGYTMPPRFVNVVHRTQTSHLPEPHDATPIEQDISVYYTNLEWAGLSFAILADRMWKSSPTMAVPEGQCVNGWWRNPEFDPATQADVDGAVLLGQRQLDFLRAWSSDWGDDTWMKIALSQTLFANVATLPPPADTDAPTPRLPIPDPGTYPEGEVRVADADSNGWPQSGRNRALRELRRAFAFHVAGDQHLASTLQYGIDAWGDGAFAFSTPSIANTWPRRWFPSEPGENRADDAPRYTGDYRDGFGNLMTIRAVANPSKTGIEPTNLYDRTPGYAIIRVNRVTRDVIFESWPRWVDPTADDAKQYPGWPIAFNQLDNGGWNAKRVLAQLECASGSLPVVHVIDEGTGVAEYSLRVPTSTFTLRVDGDGPYTVRVGDQTTTGVTPDESRVIGIN